MEDLEETVVYIPYTPANTDSKAGQNDYSNIRYAAYELTWSRCHKLIQDILQSIQDPIVNNIEQEVNTSYSPEDTLPGLPHPEMPFITLADASPSLLQQVAAKLLQNDGADEEEGGGRYVVNLHPADCTTVMGAMRALIGGVLNSERTRLENTKRRQAFNAVENYDINALVEWFQANCDARRTRLVVLLHGFEGFDQSVMQDLLYICSLHIPRLPLVFLACMSSPLSVSYLHATYPRSTLALLKVTHVGTNTARGPELMQEIIYKTFFDESSIRHQLLLPGPAALTYLQDFSRRYDGSPSSLINILQIVHLKHFSEQNPLTSLYFDSLLGSPSNKAAAKKLEDDVVAFPLFDNLLLRMEPPSLASKLLQQSKSKGKRTALELLIAMDTARQTFHGCERKLKCGLTIFRALWAFFIHRERKTVVAGRSSERIGGVVNKRRKGPWESINLIEVAVASMRGRFSTKEIDMVHEGLMTLDDDSLRVVLQEITDVLSNWPKLVDQEDDDVARFSAELTALLQNEDSERELISTLLTEFLQASAVDLSSMPLADVWYTAMTPFPSELLNPSVRASVITGLLHPEAYSLGQAVSSSQTAPKHEAAPLRMHSDTSIAFSRFLDAGRLVNVYDWFESFAGVLEESKQQQQRKSTDGADGEDEEVEEYWKIELQARFMRALHELDYMGFIKHTGRRPGHVAKTVYELPEET